jgi:hypothetical protein
MGFDIKITGLKELRDHYQSADRILTKTFDKYGDMVLTDWAKLLAVYPPERSGQQYVRTGDLGRGWSGAKPFRRGVERGIRNVVPYVKWVQGDDTQAKVHQGRWKTMKQASDEMKLDAYYDAAMKEIKKALGW